MKKSFSNLFPASRLRLSFIGFSVLLLVLASYQMIFAQVEMEDLMESLMEEIRQETREDIRQENKSETREAIASDVVRGTGGPFSGLYFGDSSSYFHNLQITQSGSTFTGSDSSIHASVTGTITGSSIHFDITCTNDSAKTAEGDLTITGTGAVGTTISGDINSGGTDCEDLSTLGSPANVDIEKIS